MTHIIEGSWEEIEAQKDALIGHHLRVIIDPVEESHHGAPEHLCILDTAHLEELLLEGIRSPSSPMTEKDWQDIRREVARRAEARANNCNV